MADKKITQLTNITGADLVDADEFVVVDISADETKAITLGELKEAFDSGSGFVRITGDTMTGPLDVQSTITSDGLTVDTNTLHVDATNNRVGIGTSSPSHLIDGRLSGTSSGEVISVGNVTNGSFGGIAISDGGTYPVRHWGSSLEFYTGNSTYSSASKAMTIDSSGNVGVGTSSPSTKIHAYDASTDAVLYVDSGNANGSHMRFLASGAVKHFVGSGGGFGLGDVDDFGIRSFDNILFSTGNSSTEAMRIESNSIKVATDEFIPTGSGKDLGSPTYQWRDLYLSGGVYLGGTGSANHLDD
jgi:hypothetical protein